MTAEGVKFWSTVIQSIGAVAAGISAFCWFIASYQGSKAKPGGFDNDVATNAAAVEQARWNGLGALFAGFTAALQAGGVAFVAYWAAHGVG